MNENKCRWMQKFKNVYIKQHFLIKQKDRLRVFIECTFQHIYNVLQYQIYSPFPSSKAAQKLHSTAQNCGTKCTTYRALKFMKKSPFLCVLVSLYRWKNKVYILIWVRRLLVEKFQKPVKLELRKMTSNFQLLTRIFL